MVFLIKTIIKMIICTIGTLFVILISFISYGDKDLQYSETGDLTPIEYAQSDMIDQFNKYKEGEEFNFTLTEDVLNVVLDDLVTGGDLKFISSDSQLDTMSIPINSYVELERDLINFNVVVSIEEIKSSIDLTATLKFEDNTKTETSLGSYKMGLEHARISNFHIDNSLLSLLSNSLTGKTTEETEFLTFEGEVIVFDKKTFVDKIKSEEDTKLYGSMLEIFWENELAELSIEEKNFQIALELEKILIDKGYMAPEYLDEIGDDLSIEAIKSSQLQSFLYRRVVDKNAKIDFSEETLNRMIYSEMDGFESLGTEVENQKIGVSNIWLEFNDNSIKFNVLIKIGEQKSLIEFEYKKKSTQPTNGDLDLEFSSATIGDSSNTDKHIVLSKGVVESLLDMVGDSLFIATINDDKDIVIEISKFEEQLSSNEEDPTIEISGIQLGDGTISLEVKTNNDVDNVISEIELELGNINSSINNSDKFSDEFKSKFDNFVDANGAPVESELENLTSAIEKFSKEEQEEMEKIFGDLNIDFSALV